MEDSAPDFSSSGLLGRVLDRKYRLTSLIGEGGMGAVFEAEHILLGRKVAVKIMHPEYVSKPQSVERFFREAKAASAIGHPNIVDVHDVGREDDDTVFIVMERLNGFCLDELIDGEGPVPREHAVSIALQILSALGAAHEKGIIHRDLKAENILLAINSRGQEEVKLLDFGIAKIEKGNKASLGLTKDGNVVGTPYYLSPEQARGGKDVDSRIDIWGVGVLLYEMLSATLPFTGENYNEILGKILLDQPVPIRELAPGAPEELLAVVEKAMAKEREDRYEDAQDMIEALYPLRRKSSDNMSTMVIKTLKGNYDLHSDPPGAPYGSRSSYPELDTGKVKKLRDSDPLAKTDDIVLGTGEMEFVESSTENGHRAKKPLLFVAVVALMALVAVLGYVFLFSGNAGRKDSAAGKISAAAPASELETPSPEPVMENVEISLKGVPTGAVVKLDGQVIALPLVREKGFTAGEIEVSAPGYEPLTVPVDFETSAELPINMKLSAPEKDGASAKSPDPKKASKSSKKKKKKGKKRPSKKKGWESNPFG